MYYGTPECSGWNTGEFRAMNIRPKDHIGCLRDRNREVYIFVCLFTVILLEYKFRGPKFCLFFLLFIYFPMLIYLNGLTGSSPEIYSLEFLKPTVAQQKSFSLWQIFLHIVYFHVEFLYNSVSDYLKRACNWQWHIITNYWLTFSV